MAAMSTWPPRCQHGCRGGKGNIGKVFFFFELGEFLVQIREAPVNCTLDLTLKPGFLGSYPENLLLHHVTLSLYLVQGCF